MINLEHSTYNYSSVLLKMNRIGYPLILNVTDRNAWDTFVTREPCFSLLQSWNWGEFKEKMGWVSFRVAVQENDQIIAGAQILIKPLPLGLAIAYIPRGPIGKWYDGEIAQLLFTELSQIARSSGAIFLKIEPAVESNQEVQNLLNQHLFRQSRINNQPKTTILLDIAREEEVILSQMRKKTRQYIHRAKREGITVRFGNSNDLPAYYNLMRLTGKREHFTVRSQTYYQTEWETFSKDHRAVLLLAYHQDQLVAARAIYCFGPHAAEFHAGSVDVPGLHQNYLLVWEAIKWAKAQGCVTYDLWGIPNEVGTGNDREEAETVDRSDGLWGVYQFKRGFSKQVVSYIGAYDYVYNPALYSLFSSGLLGGDKWERIVSAIDSLKFNSRKEGTVQRGSK